jgi:hypothetical protein
MQSVKNLRLNVNVEKTVTGRLPSKPELQELPGVGPSWRRAVSPKVKGKPTVELGVADFSPLERRILGA